MTSFMCFWNTIIIIFLLSVMMIIIFLCEHANSTFYHVNNHKTKIYICLFSFGKKKFSVYMWQKCHFTPELFCKCNVILISNLMFLWFFKYGNRDLWYVVVVSYMWGKYLNFVLSNSEMKINFPRENLTWNQKSEN